jgi:hypothetical protein
MTKALLNKLSLNAPNVWVANSGMNLRAPNNRNWELTVASTENL